LLTRAGHRFHTWCNLAIGNAVTRVLSEEPTLANAMPLLL